MRIHKTTPITGNGLLTGLLFILLTAILAPAPAAAQAPRRFKAGIIAGVTASQIDGDESAGYNKVGLQGGIRGIIVLKEKFDVSTEFLYTQRGCRNEAKTPPFFKTTLDYAEVAVQWHYHDWPVNNESDEPEYYRVDFNTGWSYARLIDYKDASDGSIAGISPALPFLKRNSVCFLIGATFFATKHLGFTFRYHRAVNRLYKPGTPGSNYAYSLNEHFLAFQTMYVF